MPDYHHEVYKISEFSNDVNGETKETQPIFLGRFLCQLISQQNSMVWPFAISGAGLGEEIVQEGEMSAIA